ncbi:MAG: hypothetical protein Q8J78_03020 [Moraxellaceae bacterium]|nr:hypothetical protein [Moraxellaceae bacterium]
MSRPLPSAELQRIREECRTLVRKRALMSAGAAVVPVPLLDIAVDAGILLQLIPEISHRFGLATDDIDAMDPARREKMWKQVRQRGSQLIGIVLTREIVRRSFQGFVGRIITKQISKFVPLGGQLVAAGLGYFVMRQIANKHIDDCYAIAAQLG